MPDESQTVGDAAARGSPGELDDFLEENGNDWQRVRPRKIHAEQLARLEEHTREIFETLGMDLSSPGTARTPRRFIKAVGQLVAEQLLDELFLTVAPRLVGPAREGSRQSLIDGADVLGRAEAAARLLSLRRHRSYVFLRYCLGR
jgi:hypothetical protein